MSRLWQWAADRVIPPYALHRCAEPRCDGGRLTRSLVRGLPPMRAVCEAQIATWRPLP